MHSVTKTLYLVRKYTMVKAFTNIKGITAWLKLCAHYYHTYNISTCSCKIIYLSSD